MAVKKGVAAISEGGAGDGMPVHSKTVASLRQLKSHEKCQPAFRNPAPKLIVGVLKSMGVYRCIHPREGYHEGEPSCVGRARDTGIGGRVRGYGAAPPGGLVRRDRLQVWV